MNYSKNNQNIINEHSIINNNNINKNNSSGNNNIKNNENNAINQKTNKKKPHSFIRKKTINYNINSNQILSKTEINNTDENFLTIINKNGNKKNILKEHWQLEKILLDYNILDFSSKYNNYNFV